LRSSLIPRLSYLLQNASIFDPVRGSYVGWATARVLAELPGGGDARSLNPLGEFLETAVIWPNTNRVSRFS
jgi:hypothetical protein